MHFFVWGSHHIDHYAGEWWALGLVGWQGVWLVAWDKTLGGKRMGRWPIAGALALFVVVILGGFAVR